jgi:hypothetical protein
MVLRISFRSLLPWVSTCCLALGCSSSSKLDATGGRRGTGFDNPVSLTAGASATASSNGGPNPNLVPSGGTRLTNSADEICASAVVQTMKNMPTIVFVIDGSGSMCAPFGQVTRWQALRSALLDPMSGFIYRLQSSVRFGATLYDGTIDVALAADAASGFGLLQNPPCSLLQATLGGKDVGMCPQLVEALPATLDHAKAIDMIYPTVELGGSTPTDKAMTHVMDALIGAQKSQGPDDPAQSRVYVILATDGAPNDICVNGVGGDGSAQRQGVVTAVDRGAAAGITTWVISLADGDADLQMHLDDVAKHGEPKNAMAHTFSPASPDELIMTLAQLLGGAVGCHIALNGTVTLGQEQLGTVEQNGVALPFCAETMPGMLSCGPTPAGSPNGWRLSDPHAIELVGDACAKFLLGSGALLSAKFPCKVFTPD